MQIKTRENINLVAKNIKIGKAGKCNQEGNGLKDRKYKAKAEHHQKRFTQKNLGLREED